MDNSVITTLIQGGAVGICLATLFIHYKTVERTNSAIEKIADSNIKNAECNIALKCAIESLEKTVQTKL